MKKTYFLLKIIVLIIFVFVLLLKIFISYFPVKYENIIEKYCEMYNVEKALVYAVINTESRFDEKSVSYKGASGLMQIMQPTADWAAQQIGIDGYSYDRIYEPEINIHIGCWILNKLYEKYDGDIILVCAAYNAGTGNVSKWLKDERFSYDGKTLNKIPFKETKNYITKVALSNKVYELIL